MKITRVSIYSVDLPTKGGSQRRRERNSPAANATSSASPVKDGRLYAPDAPGLGVEPDLESLGRPIAVYG